MLIEPIAEGSKKSINAQVLDGAHNMASCEIFIALFAQKNNGGAHNARGRDAHWREGGMFLNNFINIEILLEVLLVLQVNSREAQNE